MLLPLLFFVSQGLAVQDPPDGGCFVYPSPARGNSARVVFRLPGAGTAGIYVYNESGDLVAKDRQWKAAGLRQAALDLTHYLRGVYLCRVVLELDSGVRTELKPCKFIVAK